MKAFKLSSSVLQEVDDMIRDLDDAEVDDVSGGAGPWPGGGWWDGPRPPRPSLPGGVPLVATLPPLGQWGWK